MELVKAYLAEAGLGEIDMEIWKKITLKNEVTGPVVYTDGSARKGKVGGIGVYCKELGIEVSESFQDTTNNKMELAAILKACEILKERGIHQATIASDSVYSIKCCTVWFDKWKASGFVTSTGQPVKNLEIIQTIVALLREQRGWRLKYVPGHSGVEGNEAADALACGKR